MALFDPLGKKFAKRFLLLGGGSSFSPLSLSPSMWLDMTDLSTLFQDAARTTPCTAVGDPIGGIFDKSGNGKHATAVTTERPTLTVGSNGRYTATFDGVANRLTISYTCTATTTFVIVCTKAASINRYILGSNAPGMASIITNFSAQKIEWYSNSGADRETFITAPNAGQLYPLALAQTDTVDLTLYLSGAIAANKVPAMALNTIPLTRLGCASNDSAFFDGDISEFFVFNRILTPTEIARLM